MSTQPSKVGRYEIIEQLGLGGMGSVYLARDPELDRLVAIKLLRTGFDTDEVRERFRREAQSAASLRHPNIVTIYDVGVQDGEPFIAMEYIRGETLASLIRRRQPLSLQQTLKIVEDVCAGLAYAHKRGIVHRDIKPANITIDEDGLAKILDFGLARSTQSPGVTGAGILIGTLGYMSPEQVRGGNVDHRSDIFSLGVVLYELLTRQSAFPGGLADGILHRILTEPPRPLSEVRPGLPSEIEGILAKSLEKDAARRYEDAVAMKQDLAAVRGTLGRDESVLPADASNETRGAGAVTPTAEGPAAFTSDRPDATVIDVAPAGTELPEAAAARPVRHDDTCVLAPVPDAAKAARSTSDVQLVVTHSPDALAIGRVVRIHGPEFTLGRHECDLYLRDPAWSRRHAAIEETAEGFRIRDLQSANGTFVNGRRVRDHEPLFFGSTIAIGGTVLVFSYAKDTSLPDLTGCDVAGRYRLDRLIRDSAKASLYAATDKNLPRQLVMKLMSPELLRYPGYRKLFQREAETAAAMHHPHICRVIDFGPATLTAPNGSTIQTLYLCVDLMPGGTLTERLDSREPVALSQAAKWVTELADALEYTHRRGVCHGDLKPNAIVFDEDGNVFLTDFALAQSALNAEGRPASGTPPYMAPETWDEGVVTPATDQFALAAVTYYFVTGSRPFEGQDSPEVRQRNFRRGPIPAHEEAAVNGRTEIPPTVSEVLAKALAISPEGRYESVSAFAKEFSDAAEGHRIGLPRVFLSYERDPNAAWAMYFNRELEDLSISVFVDTEQRDRAGQFPARLAQAIRTCDVFVCLLGASTIESKWVREEIRLAYEHKRPMIPVFQERFNPKAIEAGADAALDALIAHDGVHLFDLKNVHVQHTVADLARLITNTVRKRR